MLKVRFHFLICPAICLLLVVGCTVGPDYHGVEPAESALVWRGDTTLDDSAGSVVMPETRWWERFEDPELNRLVEEALAGNFDLAQAASRVQAAYGQRGIANADRLPQLSAGGAYNAIGLGKRAPHFVPTNSSEDFQILGAGAIATWEVDLWGRVKRLVEAADANTEAARDALSNCWA
ncbi:TolC family protein [Ruficoccus amylovorans]|uniref:TolC family protein n=1 Tax=Ruficoccus amylovorans TaxID=1804625 RepID=A0A842HIK3_9BACT|nr:TolC family protein [Ruficoccus amylovorans]MBC2595404.1 TolC family protein [Ruficoccus amylovorans]